MLYFKQGYACQFGAGIIQLAASSLFFFNFRKVYAGPSAECPGAMRDPRSWTACRYPSPHRTRVRMLH